VHLFKWFVPLGICQPNLTYEDQTQEYESVLRVLAEDKLMSFKPNYWTWLRKRKENMFVVGSRPSSKRRSFLFRLSERNYEAQISMQSVSDISTFHVWQGSSSCLKLNSVFGSIQV